MSKKSRSIFMQLDAQNVADRKQIMSPKLPNSQLTKQHSSRTNRQNSENEPEVRNSEICNSQVGSDVIWLFG